MKNLLRNRRIERRKRREELKNLPFKARVKDHVNKMLSMKFTAHQFALACGLGIFIAVSPYFGLHTYMAIFASAFFGLPIYPLMVCTHAVNMVTIPIVVPFITRVGMWILDKQVDINFDLSHISIKWVLSVGKELFWPFVVGGHVVGIIAGIITYLLVYFLAKLYKSLKKEHIKTV